MQLHLKAFQYLPFGGWHSIEFCHHDGSKSRVIARIHINEASHFSGNYYSYKEQAWFQASLCELK